jgi:hypothetical protein
VKQKKGGPMEKRRFIYSAVMGVIAISLISGCAGGYGRLRVQSGHELAVTIKDVEEHAHHYIIHAWEWPAGEVSAIVFDLRDDDKTIQNDGWTRVTSPEQLSKMITVCKRSWVTEFYKILGPKEQCFGYLLGGEQYVRVETVDANTLKLNGVHWSPMGGRYAPWQP